MSQPTKQCPDCAESVLAAARKCRFCGYRFVQPAADVRHDLPAPGLLGLLRRSAVQLTMPEVLAQLGVDLEDDERPAGLWIGQVDGADAYVVVTDARLIVVGYATRGSGWRPGQEYSLAELVSAEVVRHHREARLVLQWRHAANTVVSKLQAKDAARLYSTLTS